MPFVAGLLESTHEALPYRCGIPSTTPFAQAGIIYGDNSEIPSYRWWDKQSGQLVAFGIDATFQKVAHRYFQGARPLTAGGACIAVLYAAGATDRFGPAYEERHTGKDPSRAAIRAFLTSPPTVYRWLRHGRKAVWSIATEYFS